MKALLVMRRPTQVQRAPVTHPNGRIIDSKESNASRSRDVASPIAAPAITAETKVKRPNLRNARSAGKPAAMATASPMHPKTSATNIYPFRPVELTKSTGPREIELYA